MFHHHHSAWNINTSILVLVFGCVCTFFLLPASAVRLDLDYAATGLAYDDHRDSVRFSVNSNNPQNASLMTLTTDDGDFKFLQIPDHVEMLALGFCMPICQKGACCDVHSNLNVETPLRLPVRSPPNPAVCCAGALPYVLYETALRGKSGGRCNGGTGMLLTYTVGTYRTSVCVRGSAVLYANVSGDAPYSGGYTSFVFRSWTPGTQPTSHFTPFSGCMCPPYPPSKPVF